MRAARGRRTPRAARRRPRLPLPPARHHRPPPRRRPARPGLRRARRLRVRVRRRPTSTSTCTTTSGAGSPTRDFALQPGDLTTWPSLKERVTARSSTGAGAAPRGSTTSCARRSTTASVKAQPAGRRGDLLRLPVVLPDPGAGVLRGRVRRQGLPRRGGQPGHGDRVDAARADRRRARPAARSRRSRTTPRPPGSSASSCSSTPGSAWLSALRERAASPSSSCRPREQPNFVIGKVRDLLTLAVIGVGPARGRRRLRARVRASPRTSSAWLGLGAELALAGPAGHRRAGPARQHAAVLRHVPAAGRPQTSRSAPCGRVRCSARSAFEILK